MSNTLNVELTDEVMDFVRAEAAARGLDNAVSYVMALIEQERARNAREKLADLLDEGLRSELVEVTAADWDALRERVRSRHGERIQ